MKVMKSPAMNKKRGKDSTNRASEKKRFYFRESELLKS